MHIGNDFTEAILKKGKDEIFKCVVKESNPKNQDISDIVTNPKI